MAKLYDINESLLNAIEYGIDDETGELLNDDDLSQRIESLQIELGEKLEGIANYSKSLSYDVDAFDKEIENLKKRKEQAQKRKDGLDRFLSTYLLNNGFEKGFKTARVDVKFRKSTSVNVLNQDLVPKDFIKVTTKVTESVDKTAIKNYLKANEDATVDGVELVTNMNMSIK